MYASYALLHDETVLNAFTESWLTAISAWKRASKRMKAIPGVRLSMLCALSSILKSDGIDRSKQEAAISMVSEIRKYLKPTNPNSHYHPRICELMKELSEY